MTTPTGPVRITSRANPVLVALRRLARDGAAYRRSGTVWLEGEHLCQAALLRGWPVEQALLSERAWHRPQARALVAPVDRTAIVDDALFADITSLESPSDIGFVVRVPAPPRPQALLDSVVLDRVQDAGNAGSILRSAAALGARQVLAVKGTVALWSPKVLRSGMGAHFALQVVEGLGVDEVLSLGLPLVGTSSHDGVDLPLAQLPQPCAWLLGHEGQGVAPELLDACRCRVRIPQPGGEESLNVAAAAAICLYEGWRQRQ
jgi:TrmH family RNA methyltransferase